MSLTSASVVKAITSGIAGGSALMLAIAAGLGEIPMPEGHTTLDTVILGVLAKQLWDTRKEKEALQVSTAPPEPGWKELLMQKLEDLAYGTRETQKDMRGHREDFQEFRDETNHKLSSLSGRVMLIENKLEK